MKKILQLIIVLILAATGIKIFLPEANILPASIDTALDKAIDKVPGVDIKKLSNLVRGNKEGKVIPANYQLSTGMESLTKQLLSGPKTTIGDQRALLTNIKKQLLGFKDGTEAEKKYALSGLQLNRVLFNLNRDRVLREDGYKVANNTAYRGMIGSKMTGAKKKEVFMKEQNRLWEEMISLHTKKVQKEMTKALAAQKDLLNSL